MRRLTTGEFIEKAKRAHGDKYDYSLVEYVTSNTKVPVRCPDHDVFMQKANVHLSGKGCPECGKIKNMIGRINTHLAKRDWDFEQPEDHKLVPLTQGYFAMVDNEDFYRVKDINWYYTNGYAMNDKVGLMHRYIMNAPDHLEVDHKEHDTLDNRKSELRLATQPQNLSNSRPRGDSSSNYKGVSWRGKGGYWVVQILCGGKRCYLGRFESEKEAGQAYDKKAIELRGEWAYQTLNFPELLEEYLKEIENAR